MFLVDTHKHTHTERLLSPAKIHPLKMNRSSDPAGGWQKLQPAQYAVRPPPNEMQHYSTTAAATCLSLFLQCFKYSTELLLPTFTTPFPSPTAIQPHHNNSHDSRQKMTAILPLTTPTTAKKITHTHTQPHTRDGTGCGVDRGREVSKKNDPPTTMSRDVCRNRAPRSCDRHSI